MSVLQGSLDQAYELATESSIALRVQLRSNEDTALLRVQGGSISQLGVNGRQTTFAPHGNGNITALETQQMWRYLINTFDCSQNELICQGNPTPTDAQIYAQMQCHLQPINETYPDFVELNLPQGRPACGKGLFTW